MQNFPLSSLNTLFNGIICTLLVLIFSLSDVEAQGLSDYLGDETLLYAETKQVNQFFRRFNCEESIEGKRFYPEDRLYRNSQMRVKYLQAIFDKESQNISAELKSQFIKEINETNPQYLDFHGGEWFAEVQTSFRYKGKKEPITLFLKLEEANIGSKWVFTHALFKPFQEVFSEGGPDTGKNKPAFIHPLSHELDFMELIKVFRNTKNLEQYAKAGYSPDYLTLLLYEIKRGNLSFNTVNSVKFHFFQVEGWYFELMDFQRKGANRGWLISQLVQIPKGQKELLLQYIYQK
ncbi:MAG: hypothetical protein AAF696_35770 [Bacteroidota bacterium]